MINYSILHESVVYYEKYGFARIEAPWLVPDEILNITKPPEAHAHQVIKNGKKKNFVGSAEQSFLYLINKGFLLPGRYQATTPCMRDDDFGLYHTKYFMKNELISFGDDHTVEHVQNVMQTAFSFFSKYVGDHLARKDTMRTSPHNLEIHDLLKIVKVNSTSWDIMLAGTEIGSYGFRTCLFAKWVYGTGVALPRLSRILHHLERD